jgi:hypothetical protein
MSINVEAVGGSLVAQLYVAEVREVHHCHMESLSDLQTPAGWNKIQVIRDPSVTALEGEISRHTNLVISYPTSAFLGVLEAADRRRIHTGNVTSR